MAPQTPNPNDPDFGDIGRKARDLGRDAEQEVRRAAERYDPRRDQGRTHGFSEPARRTNNNWWWLLLPLAALAAWAIWALANNDKKDDNRTPTPTPTLQTPTP